MTMPPMTAQEITDLFTKVMQGNFRLAGSIRAVKLPGQQEHSSEATTKFFIETIPEGKKRVDFMHELDVDLELLIGEFKAARLLKAPSTPKPASSESRPPVPKTELEWITSEKNPALEFLPANTPGAQVFFEWAKNKEKGLWLFDTGRGVLIFRKKGATPK
jgi:hypothetical protein